MELQRGIKRFAIGLFLLLFAVGFVPLSVFAAEEQGDADKSKLHTTIFLPARAVRMARTTCSPWRDRSRTRSPRTNMNSI